MRPVEIIGETALAQLTLAGYDVVRREPEKKPKVRYRFTCPICGYSALGGELKDVYADFGSAYHRPCVPYAYRERRGSFMRKSEERVG